MPIIRKIIPIGKTSKGITLPKSWLDYFEKEIGRPIYFVAIEVDRELKIVPYTSEKEEKRNPSSHHGQERMTT